ncbi:restriction endonuclease subunit S [Corallococcus sicarius]|uniref:Restriction endonuclease subunit S n=1 Tax=Corallococcus sicarius TaxID=2316726 RepID=A0A3A8MUM0_9BACT|nr:restriction endonuclease subunit S [Corallococcus sicarius]RKH35603.1 restriction endonuclease subunit S [Corallococcus sicarius]
MSFPRYPEYKDSGVEWLGEVPAHWELKRVGYLFDERRQKVSDKDYAALSVTKSGVVPQLATAAKTDDGDNRKLVRIGDFVINSRSDRNGSAGLSAFDGSVSLINTVLAPRREILGLYVHHLLRSVMFQEEFYRNGRGIVADLWSTNFSEMKDIVLAVPPPKEQAGITAFLDREVAKIDTLVAEQQRLIELLKEKRQGVISHAVTKGLNPQAPMKPSGVEWLGQIPAHWSLRELRHLVAAGTTITYGIVQAGPDTENGVPYIRTSDMSGDKLPMSGYLRTTHEIDAAYRRSKVSRNDLVVAIRASLGKGLLVPDHLEGANLTQGTARVSPGPGLLPKFLLRAFNSDYCQASIRIAAKGTTFLEITLDELRRVPLAVPPLQEQADIAESIDGQVGRFDRLIDEAMRAAQLLQERRTALISAAVTGQIDVRAIADRAAA